MPHLGSVSQIEFQHISPDLFRKSLKLRDRNVPNPSRIYRIGMNVTISASQNQLKREVYGLAAMSVEEVRRERGRVVLMAAFLDEDFQPVDKPTRFELIDGIAEVADPDAIAKFAQEDAEIHQIHVNQTGDDTDLELEMMTMPSIEFTLADREPVPVPVRAAD